MNTALNPSGRPALKLELMKRTTLLDIEEMTCRVAKAPLGGVDIWLAKDLGSQFFKDTHIVSLLAQAARRNGSTVRQSVPAVEG